jgi:hypothetical protein
MPALARQRFPSSAASHCLDRRLLPDGRADKVLGPCPLAESQHILFISQLIGVDGASRIGLKRFRVIWQDAVTEVYVLVWIAFAGAGIVTAEAIGPNTLSECFQRRVCKVDRTNGFGIEIAIAGL